MYERFEDEVFDELAEEYDAGYDEDFLADMGFEGDEFEEDGFEEFLEGVVDEALDAATRGRRSVTSPLSEVDALGDTDALEDLDGLDEFENAALGEFEEDLYSEDTEDSVDEFGDLFDPVTGQPVPSRPGTRRRPRPMPRPRARAAATLADLRRFSRAYVRSMVHRGQRIDCADLAIEVWIRFGERHGIPVSFRVWDSRGRRWLTASRSGVRAGRTFVRQFRSSAAFVRWVQGNLGAQGLIGNTFAVPGGHRRAVAGDVFLWQYRNTRTRALASVGHTQILDRVIRGRSGPLTDTIEVYQGNLPPVVPQLRRKPAAYFYRNRTATIGGAPHTGIPVGPGSRRFNAFRSLR